jgi:hypothetical protein
MQLQFKHRGCRSTHKARKTNHSVPSLRRSKQVTFSFNAAFVFGLPGSGVGPLPGMVWQLLSCRARRTALDKIAAVRTVKAFGLHL